MSLTRRLLGGVLCLAGGYLIGYYSGTQASLRLALGDINSAVHVVPLLPGLIDQVSTESWYLALGLVLIAVGILLVAIGGGGRAKVTNKPEAPKPDAPVRPPGSCKFCGADLKGSKTYCPSCGRSQT